MVLFFPLLPLGNFSADALVYVTKENVHCFVSYDRNDALLEREAIPNFCQVFFLCFNTDLNLGKFLIIWALFLTI